MTMPQSPFRRMMGTTTRRELLTASLAMTAGLGAAAFATRSRMAAQDVELPPSASVQANGTAGAAQPGWRRLDPSSAPPAARRDHSLVADAEGKRVYLFGGRGDGGATFNDLWRYDVTAGSWSALTPGGTAPAPRFGHNAVWDPVGGRMLLFSGQAGPTFFGDVWSYDPDANAWTKIADEGAGPQRRYGGGGHYDAGAKALYISHGFTNQGRFDDTWAFGLENEAWRDQSPGGGERPERRCLLRTGADPTRGRMLLFGGQSNSAAWLGDTWLLDLGARAWRRLDGPGPSPRNLYSLTARDDQPHLLLFGGAAAGGDTADLWQFDLSADTWTALTPPGDTPSARSGHDAVWLPGRAAMLLFGGRGGGSHRNDLWEVSFA